MRSQPPDRWVWEGLWAPRLAEGEDHTHWGVLWKEQCIESSGVELTHIEH